MNKNCTMVKTREKNKKNVCYKSNHSKLNILYVFNINKGLVVWRLLVRLKL